MLDHTERVHHTDPAGSPAAVLARSIQVSGLVVMPLALVAGAVLRFYTPSALWLDEAATVTIARLPLGEIFGALVRDGHPPVYYALLHGWMGAFGDGDTAARALAGVFGLAFLPLIWLAGRRAGGPRCSWAALLISSLSPFAVHYSNAARMYSLIMLLSVTGVLLVRDALDRPQPVRLVAVSVVAGLLTLTHYWTVWLLGAAAAVLVVAAVSASIAGAIRDRRAALLVLGAMLAGSLLFLPWFPIFVEQLRHTGTPWEAPAGVVEIGGPLLTGFAGGKWARLFLIVLGLAGLRASWRDSPRGASRIGSAFDPGAEILVAILAVFLAGAGGLVAHTAFEPRYAASLFPLVVLGVARGCSQLANASLFRLVVFLVLALSTQSIRGDLATPRTTAPSAARAIRAGYTDGVVVAYCPDDLGPAVARLLPAGIDQVTYPKFERPEFVDYRDYVLRAQRADPQAFVTRLLDRAGANDIWLVWNDKSKVFGASCARVRQMLHAARPGGRVMVTRVTRGADTTEAVDLLPGGFEP